MFDNILGTKKYTAHDLLNELRSKKFNEAKIETIFQSGVPLDWSNESSESFLHLCAKDNKTSSIQWLLKHKANINITTYNNITPIFYAVENNCEESVRLLVKKGANLKFKNNFNRNVLQDAVFKDNIKIIKNILEGDVDINNADENGYNILFDAVHTNNIETLELIASIKGLNLNQRDNNSNSVLYESFVLNNHNVFSLLVEKGIDLSLKNDKGIDAIVYYLEKDKLTLEHLQTAVSHGYDVNSKCNHKTLIIYIAQKISKIELDEVEQRQMYFSMIDYLIEHGACLDEIDNIGENVLFYAIKGEDLEVVQFILNKKIINVNHKNEEGNTALVVTALHGEKSLQITSFLLSYSANPNISDNEGVTLVEKLINVILYLQNGKKISPNFLKQIDKESDYLLIFKKILEKSKVFLRKLNSEGKPLFFDAIFYKNDHLFKMLQNYGADINHKDADGRNIIHNLLTMTNLKQFRDQKTFTKFLRELTYYGADVNSKDDTGSTTLHNAIVQSSVNIVKVLLDSKANMQAVDKKGRSLVHNCVWDSKVKHFRLVHSYNAEILNIPDKYGILPINYAAFIGHTDLVLEMITARSHVNNPHKKDPKMVSFFKKFYKNVYALDTKVMDEFSKKNIKILIQNMKTEFHLPD